MSQWPTLMAACTTSRTETATRQTPLSCTCELPLQSFHSIVHFVEPYQLCESESCHCKYHRHVSISLQYYHELQQHGVDDVSLPFTPTISNAVDVCVCVCVCECVYLCVGTTCAVMSVISKQHGPQYICTYVLCALVTTTTAVTRLYIH